MILYRKQPGAPKLAVIRCTGAGLYERATYASLVHAVLSLENEFSYLHLQYDQQPLTLVAVGAGSHYATGIYIKRVTAIVQKLLSDAGFAVGLDSEFGTTWLAPNIVLQEMREALTDVHSTDAHRG